MKILVVGGSGGIGSAIVRQLRAEGNEVWFTYHLGRAKADALEIETQAKKIPFDSNSQDSLEKLLAWIEVAGLDGLIYTAAEKFERETLLKMQVKPFLSYVDKSLHGYFCVSQAFALALKNRKAPGVIVNILSSVINGLPPAKQASYVTAKYALLGLMRCQAVEFGPYNIRVNAVSPGMVRTDFNSDLPDRFIEIYVESLPLKRLILPEEVARAACFLFSPEASLMTGVQVPVAGGES